MASPFWLLCYHYFYQLFYCDSSFGINEIKCWLNWQMDGEGEIESTDIDIHSLVKKKNSGLKSDPSG